MNNRSIDENSEKSVIPGNSAIPERRLRLCYIADLRSLHTQQWLSYFVQRGHSVMVLSPAKEEVAGIKVRRIFWWPGLPKALQLANVIPIGLILRRFRPNVLHAHYVQVYGWLAALSFFKPLVITVWGGDILEDQEGSGASGKLGKKLTLFALRRASLITAHSRFLERRVIELGAPPDRVAIVGCPGIDRRKFRPGLDASALKIELEAKQAPCVAAGTGEASTTTKAHGEARGSGDAVFVLCSRVMHRLYNMETIIRAVPLVLKEVPTAKFIFSELAADKEYVEEMKALTKELYVMGAVIFLKEIPRPRMPLFLNLASVFVSIPDSDGMPQSLLEAMSCGTVPIVSNLRQYDELIRDEINALVVPPRDVGALATAIIRLLKDDSLREKLSRACMDTIMEGMDYETEMAKMERLYYKLSGM